MAITAAEPEAAHRAAQTAVSRFEQLTTLHRRTLAATAGRCRA